MVAAMALVLRGAQAEKAPPGRAAAKKFFETGQLLYERGKFKEAAAEFEHAFAEEPRAAFVYNAAQSYDKAGDRAAAVLAYRKYLGFKESKADAAQIGARIAVLEKEQKQLEAAAAPSPVAPPPAPAAPRHTPLPYKEPATGHVFQTFVMHEGREFVLVGVGTRKVFGFKVYAMAMYIEDEAARKQFPRLAGQAGGADQRTLEESGLLPSFIIQGDFAKHAILWFSRDVTAKQTMDSYREALEKDLSPKASPDVRAAAAGFVALFDQDIKAGEEVVIHTEPDGRVGVKLGDRPVRWSPPETTMNNTAPNYDPFHDETPPGQPATPRWAGPAAAPALDIGQFMGKVYGWMGFGLALTGCVAGVAASTEGFWELMRGAPALLYGLLIAELIMVVVFSRTLHKVSFATAAAMFVSYCALSGLTFSVIFLVYTAQSIATIFYVTAGMFAAMSAIGALTKRNLDGVGRFLVMALVGVVIASLVNMFMGSSTMSWVISFVSVFVFTGLTAYDTQKIRALAQAGDDKLALLGALTLYLDFVNLFLALLRLFGRRR